MKKPSTLLVIHKEILFFINNYNGYLFDFNLLFRKLERQLDDLNNKDIVQDKISTLNYLFFLFDSINQISRSISDWLEVGLLFQKKGYPQTSIFFFTKNHPYDIKKIRKLLKDANIILSKCLVYLE